MREYKIEATTVKNLTGLECDKCKAKEIIYELGTDYVAEFSHRFGYGSKHDMKKLDFDLCEKCLFEMLKENDVKYRITG